MLSYVSEFLSKHNYKVVAAVSDGQAAIEAATRDQADVAVLDICMPRLNGIKAAETLQVINPALRIVFLTIDRDPATCHAALEAGALGYVLKAKLFTDLIPAIRRAMEGQRFVSCGCG